MLVANIIIYSNSRHFGITYDYVNHLPPVESLKNIHFYVCDFLDFFSILSVHISILIQKQLDIQFEKCSKTNDGTPTTMNVIRGHP